MLENAERLTEQGLLRLREGDVEEALALLQAAATLHPSSRNLADALALLVASMKGRGMLRQPAPGAMSPDVAHLDSGPSLPPSTAEPAAAAAPQAPPPDPRYQQTLLAVPAASLATPSPPPPQATESVAVAADPLPTPASAEAGPPTLEAAMASPGPAPPPTVEAAPPHPEVEPAPPTAEAAPPPDAKPSPSTPPGGEPVDPAYGTSALEALSEPWGAQFESGFHFAPPPPPPPPSALPASPTPAQRDPRYESTLVGASPPAAAAAAATGGDWFNAPYLPPAPMGPAQPGGGPAQEKAPANRRGPSTGPPPPNPQSCLEQCKSALDRGDTLGALTLAVQCLDLGGGRPDGAAALLEALVSQAMGRAGPLVPQIHSTAQERPMPVLARKVLHLVDGLAEAEDVSDAAGLAHVEGRVVLAYLRSIGAVQF